jgi:hypothetical protein
VAAVYAEEGSVGDVALVDRLRPGDHVCWTFTEDAERAEVTTRYVGAGLHSGDKVVYFAAAVTPAAALAELSAADAQVGPALASGQLEVADATAGYLSDGHFRAETTAARFHRLVQRARQDGYPALRTLGDMAWAADRDHGELTRYEAEINVLWAEAYAMAVCLYDRRLFAHQDLCALITAHPASAGPRSRPGEGPLLRIRQGPAGLVLSGEADLSNRDAVAAVLNTGREDSLTLDLSELRFADASVCRLIAEGRREGWLRTVGVPPPLRRLLEMADSR